MRGLIFGSMTPLPWLLPGIVVSVIVGILFAIPLGRRLGARPVVAWGLVFSVGLIVSATLTPTYRPGDLGIEHPTSCSFARLGLAPLLDMRYEGDAALNILLFIPLGLAIAFLPRSRFKAIAIVAAIAFPFAIEYIQLIAAPLGRGCESDDVIDNLTGLVVGLVVGGVASWVAGWLAGGSPARGRTDA